jgi:hypothetical protein
MAMIFIAFAIGDCPDDPVCMAREGKAPLLLLLTPLAGITTFFLIRWLVGRRK